MGAVTGGARSRAVRGLRQHERPPLGREGAADRLVDRQEIRGEGSPPLPRLPGDLADHGLDLGGAPGAVDDRHDAEAGVRDVEPWLDREQRHGKDAGPRLEALGLRHETGHRLVFGAHALGGHQHGSAREERDRVDLPSYGSQEEGRRLCAGLVEVDVRVRVVADERVGFLDHAGRDRGVQVERRDEGDAGADGLPHRGEQLALAVRRILEHHRAVERQEHAVDRPRRRQPLEERVPHVLERRPGHRPRRDGVGRDRRKDLDAGRSQHVEEPSDLGPGAAEAFHDLGAVEELGRAEVFEVRALADEGVRLLHELTDCNADGHRRGHLCVPRERFGGARPWHRPRALTSRCSRSRALPCRRR